MTPTTYGRDFAYCLKSHGGVRGFNASLWRFLLRCTLFCHSVATFLTSVSSYEGGCGFEDSDFKRLDVVPNHDENLFYTDYHDSEMQMLCHKKVQETTIKKIIHKRVGEDVVLMAEMELYNLSMLKWYNSRRNLRYRFETMDLVNLCKGSELSVNIALQYITPTKKTLKRFPMRPFNEFLDQNNIRKDFEKLHQLTNGHDIISRLSGILKHKYKCQVSETKLRNTICKSFTLENAKKSQLYKELKNWCCRKSFSILK